MAKRELSSTLRNLKFMQRAADKEVKTKKEEEVIIPDGNFQSSSTTKKCVVIMEGDPSPGAIRGRMSFQSFNPSIDKLNEEVAQPGDTPTCSGNQGGRMPNRENGLEQDGPESLKVESPNSDSNGDLKRKQAEVVPEVQFPNKSQKNGQSDQQGSSSKNSRRSHKQPKREKLDWNVLRHPKSQSKRS